MKKNKNLILEIILCVLIFVFTFLFLLVYSKNKEQKAMENELNEQSKYEELEYVCAFIENEKYLLFDKDNNYVYAILDNTLNEIGQGDTILSRGYMENNLYHIDSYDVKKCSYNSFYYTSELNDGEIYESNSWVYIYRNEILKKELWTNFVKDIETRKPNMIKIAESSGDNLILTTIFYNGESFFVVEDDSRVWDLSKNAPVFIFNNKQYLESLNIDDVILWYLTDKKDIGNTLYQNGTLKNIIDGKTKDEEQVDMFWLFVDISNKEKEDLEIWKDEYNSYFPSISMSWQEPNEDGTTFTLGTGDTTISGISGQKKGEKKDEQLELSSAFLYKNDSRDKDVKLDGTSPLNGDLSSLVVNCNKDSNILLTIDNKISGDYTIKLWNGVNVGNLEAKPTIEEKITDTTYSIIAPLGITFGEISYNGISGYCSWNFVINATK